MPSVSKAADVKAEVHYYKFDPEDLPPGLYDSPHFGQLIPGRVVEVRPDQVYLVADHPQWSKASKKQYEDQPTLAEDRDALQRPV